MNLEKYGFDESFYQCYEGMPARVTAVHRERYKLICENEKKEKVVLRTVMSRRKHKLLVNQIFIEKGAKSFIYYGKRTKIVLCYKNGEAWTDKLNHML